MSLLDNLDLTCAKMPPVSKASRKGARYFLKGLPITANPYTNLKRREQFDWAWSESEQYWLYLYDRSDTLSRAK
jgi:hypothetical protein